MRVTISLWKEKENRREKQNFLVTHLATFIVAENRKGKLKRFEIENFMFYGPNMVNKICGLPVYKFVDKIMKKIRINKIS